MKGNVVVFRFIWTLCIDTESTFEYVCDIGWEISTNDQVKCPNIFIVYQKLFISQSEFYTRRYWMYQRKENRQRLLKMKPVV